MIRRGKIRTFWSTSRNEGHLFWLMDKFGGVQISSALRGSIETMAAIFDLKEKGYDICAVNDKEKLVLDFSGVARKKQPAKLEEIIGNNSEI